MELAHLSISDLSISFFITLEWLLHKFTYHEYQSNSTGKAEENSVAIPKVFVL
ncbi:MAG TPA: hypothetical protein VK657_10310 [Terriglobales bacterium]|nr:hypothetical protein [Terriglobales bacterium]